MYVYDLLEKKKIEVQIKRVTQFKDIDHFNFDFDWEKESVFEVYKLELLESNIILGLVSINKIFEELRIEIRLIELSKMNIGKNKRYGRIAGILIAYACKESFNNGFYGFVSLIPKSKLIEHYKRQYGFVQIGRHLAVELERSEHIMKKYLTND